MFLRRVAADVWVDMQEKTSRKVEKLINKQAMLFGNPLYFIFFYLKRIKNNLVEQVLQGTNPFTRKTCHMCFQLILDLISAAATRGGGAEALTSGPPSG